MDELKLNLTNGIMRKLVAKIIAKVIRKKFGYEIGIELNNIHVVNEGGKVRIHLDVDAETTQEEFFNIIKTFGED